ncbi:hypothetical protein Tco_0268951 [Tanacetum coccineum]
MWGSSWKMDIESILSCPHHDKIEARQEAAALPSGGVIAGALLATKMAVAAEALATKMGVEAKARCAGHVSKMAATEKTTSVPAEI